MRRLVRKLACITPMMLVLSSSLTGQIKDITALKARIPSLRDSTERVALYARLGMLYTNRSLDSCYYYGARALDLAKRITDKPGEAEAMNVLAFYYNEKGNPYLAYKYVNESLAAFKRLNNKPKICELTMNVGVLLSYEGKMDQAMAKYQQAYDLSQQLAQDSIKPLVMLNLALARSFTPGTPDVLPLVDEAERLAEKQGNERFVVIARLTRNGVRFRSGAPADEVIPDQHALIAATKEFGYEYFTALAYMELANMYLLLNTDSALRYFESAIELADKTGYEGLHFETMTQAYETLVRMQPMPTQANVYGRELLELSRERALENQKTGMDYLQLALNEQEVEAAQAKLRLRRTLGVLWGAIGMLAILFSLLFFGLYRKKRRLAKTLKNSNDRLEAQNDLLEENDAFHQQLISIMSHDLRQPLSAMLMLGEGGMVEQMSDTQRQYVFDQISQNARTSLQAMDGLVHWMKLNTLGLAYSPAVVNLKGNVREALGYNGALVDQKDIAIMDFIPESIALLAQSEMLLFVNRNILGNALRYTPVGGKIVLTAKRDGDQAVVCIADSGKGIPEQVLPYLFAKERPDMANGGSGLALIVCHEMITKMKGRIWADNHPEGGARFYYSLPIASSTIKD